MKEEGESADADIASCYYHWFLRGIHVVTTTQDKSGKVLDICFKDLTEEVTNLFLLRSHGLLNID